MKKSLKDTKSDNKPLVSIEKRGKKWQKRSYWVNGSKRGIPLLARIFGKRKCSISDNEVYCVEVHAIIYRGKCYTYKETVTLIEDIEDPTKKRGDINVGT